jgi:uncharacterized membrane protein YsdA (DUF1294 family)/cold shock CspA family protein
MNLIDRDGSREERESAESVTDRVMGESKATSPKKIKRKEERPLWLKGKIAQWDDGRGFGWVVPETAAGSSGTAKNRVFVHIKEFGRGPRPQVGDVVTFLMGKDAQGRACAKNLRFLSKGLVLRTVGTSSLMGLAGLLVLPVLASLKLPLQAWVVPGWMLVMSVAAWVVYRIDKKAAVNGVSRIPENTLHVLELLGGWPGAFLAQRVFRHKSAKVRYRVVFWAIVFLHQAVALDVVLDHWLSRELLSSFEHFEAK